MKCGAVVSKIKLCISDRPFNHCKSLLRDIVAYFAVTICMKLDPDIHIVVHSGFFFKPGVTVFHVSCWFHFAEQLIGTPTLLTSRPDQDGTQVKENLSGGIMGDTMCVQENHFAA